MADRVGMSLEEIISKNKSSFSIRRGRGGRGRGRGRGAPSGRGNSRGRGASRGMRRGTPRGRGSFSGRSPRGNINSQWSHDMHRGGTSSFSPKAPSPGRTKLVVGNLYFGVSDSDIKELFAEFGAIRASAVHYDKSGRSLGTAHVIFERRSDAMKAMNHYHNVDLDNRPMKITIEDERGSAPVIVKSPLRGGRGNLKRLQKGPRPITNGTTQRVSRRGSFSRGNFGGRGGRRGRGGAGRGRGQKKMPTSEELDAELEEYSVQASK